MRDIGLCFKVEPRRVEVVQRAGKAVYKTVVVATSLVDALKKAEVGMCVDKVKLRVVG